MSFQDLVPSQIDATQYLENVAKNWKGNVRVGGHSKGGNLAVYASMCCSPEVKEKIIEVYNNDGPGFQENIINSKEYKEIIEKVHTYLPQSSIIGRLLNHKEECIIVKSVQRGIMQHDLYTWQVLGDKFIKDEFTNFSKYIDATITNWLKEVSPEERNKFVDILFNILTMTNVSTLKEMKQNWFVSAKTILSSYKNIDEESRKIILKTLTTLFNSAKENIKI